MIKVKVYCGCYIPGTQRWRLYDDWVWEGDECCWEDEIEVDEEEWDEEAYQAQACTPPVASVTCGGCGTLLEDSSHYEKL
jgi:hypothetical protein